MIDFNVIKQANQDIKDLIEKHPHLQSFQDELSQILAKCGNNRNNRMTTLYTLMAKKQLEMHEKLCELQSLIKEYKGDR